jgi:hypothetical protein
MRRSFVLAAAIATATLVMAQPGSAQLGIAAKAGTTGVGGELTLGFGRLALRGSATTIPMKPTGTFSDVDYQVQPPTPMFTAGLDLYLARGLRLFGGVLFGADKLTLDGTYNGSVEIGDQTYNGSGTITALVERSSTAPFAGIGFGRTFGSGIGLFLDIGGALLGESTVTLSATGPVTAAPDYEANRQKEQQSIQEDVDKYAKVYPLLNLGLRVGIGGR